MVRVRECEKSRAVRLGRLGRLGALVLATGCSDFGTAPPVEPGPESPVSRVSQALSPPGSVLGAELQLLAPDGTRDDELGRAVAVSGDTLLVSAPLVSAVYVFVRNVDQWTFLQKLEPPAAQSAAGFGWSLALEGDTALVGSWTNVLDPGRVYVFERSSGMFALTQTLEPSVLDPPQEFGYSVSLDGDWAAVGAWNQGSSSAMDTESSAYVFERSGGSFREVQRLVATDPDARFGQVVDLSGDTLLITAPWRTSTLHQGTAYFYVRSGTSFELARAFDGEQNEFLGYTALLDGDTAFVSGNSGWHHFLRTAGVWSPGPDLSFGASAIQGDRLVHIGQDQDGLGTVHMVERDGGVWAEAAVVTASARTTDDYFGTAVDLDANTIVVGALGIDGPSNRGAAYVYRYGLTLGEDCATADDCLSARCVDGRCCDGDCTGPCGACSVAEGAAEDGRCTVFPRGDPGSPSCGTLTCTGEGSACVPCARDTDCPSGRYCAAGGRCDPQKAEGAECDLGAGNDCEVFGCRACATEHCVDGVCCERACDGQCEACAEPGTTGACVAIEGEPRGSREPCDPVGDPECSARCDGAEPAECTYVSSTVECGGSCENDEQIVATCDGQGRCVEGDPEPCAPYLCGAGACLTRCTSSADCGEGHRCASGECVPAVGRCSEDGSEAISSDGEGVACFPYRCEESSGTCRADCDATGDCASGRVCDPDAKSCIEPPDDVGDDAGCGCRMSGTSTRPTALVAWLTAFLLLRRRRR